MRRLFLWLRCLSTFPNYSRKTNIFLRVLRRLRSGVDFCVLFCFVFSDPEPARRAESLLGAAPEKTKEHRRED